MTQAHTWPTNVTLHDELTHTTTKCDLISLWPTYAGVWSQTPLQPTCSISHTSPISIPETHCSPMGFHAPPEKNACNITYSACPPTTIQTSCLHHSIIGFSWHIKSSCFLQWWRLTLQQYSEWLPLTVHARNSWVMRLKCFNISAEGGARYAVYTVIIIGLGWCYGQKCKDTWSGIQPFTSCWNCINMGKASLSHLIAHLCVCPYIFSLGEAWCWHVVSHTLTILSRQSDSKTSFRYLLNHRQGCPSSPNWLKKALWKKSIWATK